MTIRSSARDWLAQHPFPDCPFCPIPAPVLREWKHGKTGEVVVAFTPLHPVYGSRVATSERSSP